MFQALLQKLGEKEGKGRCLFPKLEATATTNESYRALIAPEHVTTCTVELNSVISCYTIT